MFTGIVGSLGTIANVHLRDQVRGLSIATRDQSPLPAIGASIAVSGICLTVVRAMGDPGDAMIEVDLAPETLALTTAQHWTKGTRVNLERSLRVGDELGGHLVQGHVDGVARVLLREEVGESVRFEF